MQIKETDLPGVLLIEPKVFGDERGYFLETWSRERYQGQGLGAVFVQDNLSKSRRGTLRGLHLQHPHGQAKLVYVVTGEVFDVAVDVRVGSPTFGHWFGTELSEANKRQMYIPTGYAHGFCVLSEDAVFAYKCTEGYRPESEVTIAYDDPLLGIAWPVSSPTLSKKDLAGLRLAAVPEARCLVISPEAAMLREPFLVLGPAGMLGRATTLGLAQRGLAYRSAPRASVDLTRFESLASGIPAGIGTVINCAAWTNVDAAESHEEEATRANGLGVGELAAHCKAIGAVLVHYSTDYVFEGHASAPYEVGHTRAPLNAYGRSKALGESLLEQSGAAYLLLRTSWVYAPWGKNFVRTSWVSHRRGLR